MKRDELYEEVKKECRKAQKLITKLLNKTDIFYRHRDDIVKANILVYALEYLCWARDLMTDDFLPELLAATDSAICIACDEMKKLTAEAE